MPLFYCLFGSLTLSVNSYMELPIAMPRMIPRRLPRRARFHAYRYAVEGSGYFPFDMLRYDRCVVCTPKDHHNAFLESALFRRVELCAYAPAGLDFWPDERRWQQFGWSIVAGSVRPVMD